MKKRYMGGIIICFMIGQSFSFILVIVLFLFSCSKEESKPQAREEVVEVKTVAVKFTDYPLTYKTSGQLEAVESVKVRPLVSGRVERTYVEEGMRVKEGDPLLKIEDSDYRALYEEALWNLEQTKKEFENSRTVFERRKDLYKKELISREEFDTAKTKMESLEARVRSLQALVDKRKLDLGRTQVLSPIDGYIVRRSVNVGDLVGPESICFEIVKLDPLRFVFRIPQETAPYLKVGSEVELKVGTERLSSKVVYISPSADTDKMFIVKTLVRNGGGNLKPGMYGEVTFRYGKVRAVLVPENAVQLSQRQTFLWVMKGSRAMKVPVKVIGHREGVLVVTGRLREGERIIVENLLSLKEGVRVREL